MSNEWCKHDDCSEFGSFTADQGGVLCLLAFVYKRKIIMKSRLTTTSTLLLLTLLSACSSIGSLEFPGVYKISIPQGNIITQTMVDQLQPGLTKRQVIFVMGTPLVRDPFHQDRWDYIYSFQPGGGVRGQERITVHFVDDQLVSFTGDFVPNSAEESQASNAATANQDSVN